MDPFYEGFLKKSPLCCYAIWHTFRALHAPRAVPSRVQLLYTHTGCGVTGTAPSQSWDPSTIQSSRRCKQRGTGLCSCGGVFFFFPSYSVVLVNVAKKATNPALYGLGKINTSNRFPHISYFALPLFRRQRSFNQQILLTEV